MKSPCKDCKERCINCHAACEKYINWRSEFEKQKHTISKVRNLEVQLNLANRCVQKIVHSQY